MCPVTLGQLDFIRHWYIRVKHFFLIDSCHGNKLEHRHFVRRVFFPLLSALLSLFSNVLPSRRNNAVSGYIFDVFGCRNASSGSDQEAQEADVLNVVGENN